MQKILFIFKHQNGFLLLPIILTIAIIAPLNNDIFIPSIPAINKSFNIEHAQWLLSVGLISIACAQLFSGALMDYFGRKPIILLCLLIFLAAGIGISFSNKFNLMLVYRILQSIGASCAIVGAISIAKDSAPKEKLVYYTSFIFGIISISPLLAPVLGSYLQAAFNWRGPFIFLAIIGIFYFIIITVFFKESINERDQIQIKLLIQTYCSLLKKREYLYYIIINCVSYITIFSFIAISPVIIIQRLRYNVVSFGYIFLIFSGTLFFMNILSPKLSVNKGFKKLSFFATLIMLIGSLILFIANVFYSNLLSFLIPMIIVGIGCGIIRPTASAAVMQLFPAKIAGKTIALYSFSFYITSGIATIFSHRLILYSLIPFSLFLLLFITIAFITSIILLK